MLRAPDAWAEDMLADARAVDLDEFARATGTHLVGMTGRLRVFGLDSLRRCTAPNPVYVHPSVTAVRHFYEEPGDGSVALLRSPGVNEATEATSMVAVVGSFNGVSAMNGLMLGAPWTTPLKALGRSDGFDLQAV